MAERFTRTYTLPEGLYTPGAPVLIAAGALLKDNQTGQMLAQLKIKNISAKEIKAATVKLTAFDTAGRQLEAGAEQQYLDLQIGRDNYFGETVPVVIADATARSYEVAATEVIFADNTIWSGADTPWQKQIALTPLSETLTDPELITQYGINLNKEPSLLKCLPQEQADLWVCPCGAINHKEENTCHSCKSELGTLKATLDIKKLDEDKNARLEAARQKAEAEAKEKAEKAAKAKAKAAKATKKTIVYAICAVVILSVGFFAFQAISKSNNYKAAVAAMEAGDYGTAIGRFRSLGNYKDSNTYSKQIIEMQQKRNNVISAGNDYTVGLKSDGTVVATGNNHYGQCEVDDWKNIIAVSAGSRHTVGLKADGTVVATGDNDDGRCDVNGWKNIIAVFAGSYHTVGLKSDGTVVATGWNEDGECDVSDWKDIIAVSAGSYHTVGLKSDGTVVATRYLGDIDLYGGQCDVSGWADIVAVSAGSYHTVGLKSDGTVVATGWNEDGECDVSDWKDIVAISAGEYYTVGLKADGTVVAAGYNLYGGCDVSGWKDIIAVSAGVWHTVGLKSDGTVVATESNSKGQCNVNNWKDIMIPGK